MVKLFFDRQIDVHGYYLEDAIYELEEILFCSHAESILVIHGHGSGVLKNGLREFIKNNPHIKSFEYGENLNLPGGGGVTVVWT